MAVPEVAARLAKAVMETIPEEIVRELTRHIHGGLDAAASRSTSIPDSASSTSAATPCFEHEPVVHLWPSEVGSYVGQDSWRTREQALAEVWERTHPTSFRAERAAWLARGRVARRQSGSPSLVAAYGANQSLGTDPFPSIATADAVARFCTTASPQDMLKLFKTKGQLLEEETAQLFASVVQQPLSLRNTGSVWRPETDRPAVPSGTVSRPRPPGDITQPGPFLFTGAVDGWLTQDPYKDVIVEFKLRMRAVPPSIPLRDILQVQAYMAMHGVTRTAHVQRVIGSSDLVVNMVSWDPVLWHDTVMPDIRKFVCDVRRLIRGSADDDAIRHRVLTAAEKLALPLAQLPTVMAAELRAHTQQAHGQRQNTATALRGEPVAAPAPPPPQPMRRDDPLLTVCTFHHTEEIVTHVSASTALAASASASASASPIAQTVLYEPPQPLVSSPVKPLLETPLALSPSPSASPSASPSPPPSPSPSMAVHTHVKTAGPARKRGRGITVTRLPVMQMQMQMQMQVQAGPSTAAVRQARKRMAVTALRDILSLSSTVKTRVGRVYNTRLRSRSGSQSRSCTRSRTRTRLGTCPDTNTNTAAVNAAVGTAVCVRTHTRSRTKSR
jgi:hypothetical protein